VGTFHKFVSYVDAVEVVTPYALGWRSRLLQVHIYTLDSVPAEGIRVDFHSHTNVPCLLCMHQRSNAEETRRLPLHVCGYASHAALLPSQRRSS
jgi:hypothetical protein